MSDRRPLAVVASVVVLAAFLAAPGCMVGPNYRPPAVATPASWSGLSSPAAESRIAADSRAGSESRPVATSRPDAGPADVAAWWRNFDDPVLTGLVERAVRGNLSIAQAQARVCQARAARAAELGALYPQVTGDLSGNRSGTRVANAHSSYRAGFDASWEIDIFGGTRRAVEAATADLRAAEADALAMRVTVAGEVGSTYLEIRSGQRQLAIARRNLSAQQQTLDLTKDRLDAGFVSALDVANARAQVASTGSQIPTIEAQVQSSIFALSVLLGEEPGALVAELTLPPAAADVIPPAPMIPGGIPIGLPSEILQRRPDISKAEAELHAATARIGVAIADQWPRFSLTGSLATQGIHAGSLIHAANRAWSIGPSMSLPLITGGSGPARIAEARAVACGALLAYKASVLVALQDVETALVNFTHEQERRVFLAESVDANRQAADLSLQQYSAGKTDFLNVLSAQRQLYVTEASLAQSDTNVATDLVALYKALGGGW
jgi:multidrug efflux system outer membrane protein